MKGKKATEKNRALTNQTTHTDTQRKCLQKSIGDNACNAAPEINQS